METWISYMKFNKIAMKGISHPGSRTPEASECRRPGPPPHQKSFTSAPHCSRNCSCDARKRRNEAEDEIRRWMLENFMKATNKYKCKQMDELKDSGIYSANDSDKENQP
ncbi:ATP-dependent helicase/nuclease subunit [Dirofilaria immitis]